MGAVYSGEEISPDGMKRPVACKVISRRFRTSGEMVSLFRTEVATHRRISDGHDGLVTFYHWFQDLEKRDFLVMELVPGCNLTEICSTHERLSFDIIRLIARDVLDVLAYVHGHEVVHRDISPSNVLISQMGEVKVLDFGLAKSPTFQPDGEKKSKFRGKRQYVSPEVVLGQGADERSDLYSFASVLYELLMGEPPFGDDITYEQLFVKASAWSVPELPEHLPEDLRMLTMGLLRRHPHERTPSTAAEARDLLHLDDENGTRSALASLTDAVYQRATAARAKRQLRGSFAGVRIRGLYITDGLGSQPGKISETPMEHRQRPSIARYGVISAIGLAATVALALAAYNLQRTNEMRPAMIDTAAAVERSDAANAARKPGTPPLPSQESRAPEAPKRSIVGGSQPSVSMTLGALIAKTPDAETPPHAAAEAAEAAEIANAEEERVRPRSRKRRSRFVRRSYRAQKVRPQ